jgi:hypothetical protein
MVKIYTLSCPDTKEIRYVGKTIKTLKARLQHHISTSKKRKNYNANWIKSITNNNKEPVIELVEECDLNEWEFWEKYWISQFKNWGFKLTNYTNGGQGPHGRITKKETKEKISKALKGRIFSKKTKEKMSKSRIGYKHSKEIMEKSSTKRMGLKRSEETKEKMRKSHIGKKMSDSFKEKCAERRRGKPALTVKKVMQINSNGVKECFSSITIASNKTGISITSIHNCLNGLSKSAGGSKWFYI